MIIQQAFVRETINAWVAVTVIVVAIFSVTRLVGFLGSATDGNIALESVFVLLSLKLISYLDVILVLSAYLSVLLVLGRWINDREMTALNTAGIGLNFFLRPVFVLFMIAGAIVGAFSLYLGPLAGQIGDQIEQDFRNRSDIVGISIGEFNYIRDDTWVYFISDRNPETGVYSDIFLHRDGVREHAVISAKTGYVDLGKHNGHDLLVLNNGSEYRMNALDDSYSSTSFDSYSVRLRKGSSGPSHVPFKNRSTLELLEGHASQARTELHWRISKICMLGVLLLLSLSFAAPSFRKGRFLSMLSAFLIYFFYTNILGAATALDGNSALSPYLVLWSTHLALLALGVVLFYVRYRSIRLITRKPA